MHYDMCLMTQPTSISLVRRPGKNPESPDDAFRLSFARNLTHALNSSQVVPESEVNKVEIVAGLLQTDASIVASWLSGRSLPDALDLHKIAKLLHVSIDDLINPGRQRRSEIQAIDEEYHCITVHDSSTSEGYSIYTLPETLRHLKLPRCTSMLSIGDDSMSPLFRFGDIVIYDFRVTSFASNGLYVLRGQDGYYVRRVVKTAQNAITLLPENKDYFPSDHASTDFTGNPEMEGKILIVGRVVGRMNVGNL